MSVEPAHDRLRGVLGKPGLERLLVRLEQRFERNIDNPILVLTNVNPTEHRAIAGLLGKPVAGGKSLRVQIHDLESALQKAGLADNLRTAVALVRGPIRDLPAERSALVRAWDDVFDQATAQANKLNLCDWLDELRAGGLLKRLSRREPVQADSLLNDAFAVLARLPGHGQPLSTLAAASLGDAHGLDNGRPVTTLVMRAIRSSRRDADDDDSEESIRELWASAGILVGGAITSMVLVHNLPACGESGCDRIIREAGRDGQPVWLTLRHLVTDRPQWSTRQRDVFICENPAVVAEAAERLGTGSAALVCTFGQRGAALGFLLNSLREAGAGLRYHGDFDWPGIRIANGLIRCFGVAPWRFGTAEYLAATARASLPLEGNPIAAVWDSQLGTSMTQSGLAVPEELVLEELLEDLEAGGSDAS